MPGCRGGCGAPREPHNLTSLGTCCECSRILASLLEMSLRGLPSNPALSLSELDPQSLASTSTAHQPPPELEQTLALLTSHRSVLGYMLLSRTQPVTIIRHSGVIFEGEQGKKYAHVIGRIVETVHAGLEEVSAESAEAVSTFQTQAY